MFLPHLFYLSSARNINTSVLEERLLEGGLHDSRHHWVSIASSAREILCGYQFTSGMGFTIGKAVDRLVRNTQSSV
jgi:hypothetical protein